MLVYQKLNSNDLLSFELWQFLSYCVKVSVQYISESRRTAAFSWPCEFTIVSLDIRM